MRRLAALGVVALLAAGAPCAGAQVAPAPAPAAPPAPRAAVVVQIAGSTLYIGLGTEAGLRTGDSLTVRRTAAGTPIGRVAVVGATATRSVLGFLGTPFAVTRGDTLYVTPAVAVDGARLAAAAGPRVARAPPADGRTAAARVVDGAIGVEVWGAHTETIGLGSDPVRNVRDVATPAVRYRTRVAQGSSELRVNARAQYRTGPATLWDRSMRLRLYEARYDRRTAATQLTAGRFFSDFDYASGFWDGVALRVGDADGVFGGMAAGFDPARGNEEFDLRVPKVALHAGLRRSRGRRDFETVLAGHRTFGKDTLLHRAVLDWTTRLRAGRVSYSQEVAVSPRTINDRWELSRLLVRTAVPLTDATTLYASAVSDRPLILADTGWTQPLSRRERVAAGVSFFARNGLSADVNASLNGPRDTIQAVAGSLSLLTPELAGRVTLGLAGTWYDAPTSRGYIANPSAEFLVGPTRVRVAYQLWQSATPTATLRTHGTDVRLSQAVFSPRVNWVLQASGRLGAHLRSTAVYSSVEVRF